MGEKRLIDELINEFSKKNYDNNIKYIAVKISEPVADKLYEINKNEEYIIDDGIESAQCYTYAEGYDKNLYMIMSIKKQGNINMLGYPKFEISEEDDDPEDIVLNWIKSNTNKIPNGIKKNIKLITVVGIDSNILVVSTKIR